MSNDKDTLKQRIEKLEQDINAKEEEVPTSSGYGTASAVIIELVVPITAGAFLGRYLDQYFAIAPTLTIVLLLLGFGAGCLSIWKRINGYDTRMGFRKDDKE